MPSPYGFSKQNTMKYLFAAVAFWSIGYVLPTFSFPVQIVVAFTMLLFLVIAVYYYIDTRVIALRLH
jgi:hypothetical protein